MNKNPFIVGLTGGIGSGKSTVAEAFAKLGINAVDADLASRAVVEPGMPALKNITEHFPNSDIIQPNGQLNRPLLRQIIFTDAEEKLWLETLLHPSPKRCSPITNALLLTSPTHYNKKVPPT